METILTFAAIVGLIVGILQIILFFKLWDMTNNIRRIKEMYVDSLSTTQTPLSDIDTNLGVLVVDVRTGKQMRRKDFNEETGKYKCYTNGGTVFAGEFSESEIKLF